MQRIPIEVAQADLPELIEAALSGEEIFIAKNGEHAVLLAPVTRRKFKLGLLDGRLGDGPDFFEPMDRVELELWEGSPAPGSRTSPSRHARACPGYPHRADT